MNLVVPLASYHTDSGLSESGIERVKRVASVLKEDSTSLAIVTGGRLSYGASDPHHPYVTAELERHGIGGDRIFATLADPTHTIDEAASIAQCTKSVPWEQLCVVTSLAHYPRAPFVFAHFFPLGKLYFVFVSDDRAKDVVRFTYFKEAEAYQELRRQGGLQLADGTFLATNFSYESFAELLRNRTELSVPGLREHESKLTERVDFFKLFKPHLAYQKNGGT